MKRPTKADREAVRNKFGGRCAYCGHDLPERWHCDHVEPVVRLDGVYGKGTPPRHPENNRLDNLYPACPTCNLDKHSMSIEDWRGWLATHMRSLQRQSIYRLMLAYGLVVETGKPVEFHFERSGGQP